MNKLISKYPICSWCVLVAKIKQCTWIFFVVDSKYEKGRVHSISDFTCHVLAVAFLKISDGLFILFYSTMYSTC